MKIFFLVGGISFSAAALSGIITSSNADPAQIEATASVESENRMPNADMLVKTDDYLVPAYICADADAEKYEDCVPWAHVGDYLVFTRPEAK